MARLKVYKDNYVETTAVSNCFIDNYMEDANDAQLKVYLYLIRMIGANLPTSVSDIADKFNHTEREVLRALKFWEKKKLLVLDYDDSKNLVGIHLCHLKSGESASATVNAENTSVTMNTENASVTVSTEHASLTMGSANSSQPGNVGNSSLVTNEENPSSLPQQSKVATIEAPVASEKSSVTEEDSSATEEVNPFAKPVYTPDQMKVFRSKEGTQQLLFAAQLYIGRPLTASEMKTVLYFSDILHFSDDLIDYLIQYCVDRDKKDFRYIEKVAISWAEQGISTVKQAKKISGKYDKDVYNIMNALGKTSSPTQKEVEFIQRWLKEYSFTTDIITEACDRTVLATDKHRFEYAEGILSSWFRSGVHHKSDIKKLDEQFTKKKPDTPAPFAGSGNKFNQFQQNDYDFESLEKKLLSNQ